MNYVLVLIDYLPDNLNVVVNSILSVDKDSKEYTYVLIKILI